MPAPAQPKLYHIAHVDRLASIISDECFWCDREVLRRAAPGTSIGMSDIKERRLHELTLKSHPDLYVGDCVPFYFCPRSIMLFLIYRGNHPNLSYTGGQSSIIHFEADLRSVVNWANKNNRRWAFTLSNAGSYHFEDRASLDQLEEIDWNAVQATNWQHCREGKQAEFLLEGNLPWRLVDRIGVMTRGILQQVSNALPVSGHRPPVELRPEWYY